jgi:hypothetical protein
MGDHDSITSLLVRLGQDLLVAPPESPDFNIPAEANNLIADLQGHPHAFVLACLMDKQIKAERAWAIPFEVLRDQGSFEMAALATVRAEAWEQLFVSKKLHRFPREMSRVFAAGVARISDVYLGDASRIWRDRPTSARLVCRFLEFRGAGPKIATMAANILVRDFRVPVQDYYCIDISPDVMVRRVFTRLGLIPEGASDDEIVYAAREANPEFPGVFDLVVWQIGRNYCLAKAPICTECPLQAVCRSAS